MRTFEEGRKSGDLLFFSGVCEEIEGEHEGLQGRNEHFLREVQVRICKEANFLQSTSTSLSQKQLIQSQKRRIKLPHLMMQPRTKPRNPT